MEQNRIDQIAHLFDLLARCKGKIVSSASLSVEEIEKARAGNRFYVDERGFGYAWVRDREYNPNSQIIP